ncbi:BQ5605_C002g01068 [Microbotryum silenes-dioicae]|uniref:BQ5605_C002g01068 protein n=1 Tax=Microbotryum silenes-dioicae TaxID=796604 RepID=A0A2X0P0Y7_9BASI|nr:BQ5605_C002g01068 [Microbotryum silenes-dioicae]
MIPPLLPLQALTFLSLLVPTTYAFEQHDPANPQRSSRSSMTLTSTLVKREPGRCAMRSSCGKKGVFGGSLPCPFDGEAQENSDPTYLAVLAQVCGEAFPKKTCCDLEQLQTLQSSLAQAEPLLATCPACRNNFRHFYCSFTCSPDQSLFVKVTETQKLKSPDGEEKDAVKSVDFDVAERFGKGFYDSCKDVKFGATNGYAMQFLGGGAKDYLAFLRYMGQERALGSPFQINFPNHSSSPSLLLDNSPIQSLDNSTAVPFDDSPLSCSSSDINARCACPDCPSTCAILPPLQSPAERYAHRCRVGKMSCFAFSLTILYAVGLVSFFVLVALKDVLWSRQSYLKSITTNDDDGLDQGAWTRLRNRFSFTEWTSRPDTNDYDRVPMEDPLTGDYEESPRVLGGVSPLPGSTSSTGQSSSGNNSLVGATSTQNAAERETGRGRPPSGGTISSNLSTSSSYPRNRSSVGASLLDPNSDSTNPFLQPRTYKLNTILSQRFYRLGLFCAKSPYLTLSIGLILCGLINIGWDKFEVEKDPVRLWVPHGSTTERQKELFEYDFGPFYRTEQIFISRAPTNLAVEEVQLMKWRAVDEPVLNWEVLQWWAGVEKEIRGLQSERDNATLADVCFSPATEPERPVDASLCVTQSFMGYLADSLQGVSEETWANTLNQCATTPAACLPASGQPINPKLVYGKIPDGEAGAIVRADQARALVVTYVVRNSLDKEIIAKAQSWEAKLLTYLHDLARHDGEAARLGLELAFSTESSLEEELNASTNTDVPIVVLSYVFMFLYVAINLGSSGAGILKVVGRTLLFLVASFVQVFRRAVSSDRRRTEALELSVSGSTLGLGDYIRRQVLVDSKFLLGLWGIIIVLVSVSTSVALCSALGVKVTLVIAEVIPFLVLAIGVDNVFILSHELDQQNQRAYAAASRHGPLFGGDSLGRGENDDLGIDDDPEGLPSAEERVARAVGRMGPSILLSASCETVAFALGALVGMPAVRNFAIYSAVAVLVNAVLQMTVFVSAMAIDLRRVESNRIDCFPCVKLAPASSFDLGSTVSEGFLARFIRTVYAPILLFKPVKYFVVSLFGGLFVLSWIGARHVTLGLDQRLALPGSSYLVDYFNAVDSFLDVGPPVYFVAQNLNFSSLDTVKSICGRFSTCQELSFANILEAERKRPDSSFVAEPPAVWIDDFFQWLNPLLEDCCRVKISDPNVFCGPNDSEFQCRPCFEDREPGWNITLDGLPEGDEFMRLLEHWLESPTDESCPLGGKAAYSSALKIQDHSVKTSHFRTYHTPLKTQDDFINAYASAQRISAELSKKTGAEVFPYSVFYVFFASYAHLWSTARVVLSISLLAIFLVTALLLGSLRTASVVLLTVFLSCVNVLGLMGAWHISLNPISLVNLVISLGIAVEFCSHIARAFMGANGGGLPYHHVQGEKDRNDRSITALIDVGTSVIEGITLTKLIGISVLASTKSQLLETYFAKMWFGLILVGAVNGLVFLPVALSFWGGQGQFCSLLFEHSDFMGGGGYYNTDAGVTH